MATVLNNPGDREENNGSAGWAVAIIILLAVIGIGVYLWSQYQGAGPAVSPPSTSGDTTINVTLPGVGATSSATASPSQ